MARIGFKSGLKDKQCCQTANAKTPHEPSFSSFIDPAADIYVNS